MLISNTLNIGAHVGGCMPVISGVYFSFLIISLMAQINAINELFQCPCRPNFTYRYYFTWRSNFWRCLMTALHCIWRFNTNVDNFIWNERMKGRKNAKRLYNIVWKSLGFCVKEYYVYCLSECLQKVVRERIWKEWVSELLYCRWQSVMYFLMKTGHIYR